LGQRGRVKTHLDEEIVGDGNEDDLPRAAPSVVRHPCMELALPLPPQLLLEREGRLLADTVEQVANHSYFCHKGRTLTHPGKRKAAEHLP